MIPKLFSPDMLADSPIIARTRELMLNTPSAGIIGSLQGMAARPDSTELLAAVKIPFLLVAGKNDQVIPPEKAKTLTAAIPKATLVLIEHSGHMPMLERPDTTATAMREFLARIR